MPRALKLVFDGIHIFLVRLSQLLIIGMVVLIAANIFMRFVLDSGIFWSEEVAILFATWFIFIALALGVKQRLHIALHIIPQSRLPKPVNAFLDRLDFIVALAVGVVMVVYGLKLVKFTSSSIMPATGWPAATQYLPLPISGFLIIYEAGVKLLGIDTKDAEMDAKFSGEAPSGKEPSGKEPVAAGADGKES